MFNNSSNISNYNLNGSNHEIKLKPFDNSSVMNKNRIYDYFYKCKIGSKQKSLLGTKSLN